jgi:predicted TIM-barrel fold metal-dependent hydrolase
MIIDCHTHVNTDGDDNNASEHLAAAENVDGSIVLAQPANSEKEPNKALSNYVKTHDNKMTGFAVIDPTNDDIRPKALTAATERLGLKGIVLYCARCGFHPCHSLAMQMYESAEKAGLPVFFHNGGVLRPEAVLDFAQPYLLDEIARTFGDLKIIIGNMGEPFQEQTLAVVAKNKNVYADLTVRPNELWHVYNTVITAHERGVMEKLLFGSGFPDGTAGECIEALLGFNKLLGDTNLPTVPRGSIKNIIERDALSLLGIER